MKYGRIIELDIRKAPDNPGEIRNICSQQTLGRGRVCERDGYRRWGARSTAVALAHEEVEKKKTKTKWETGEFHKTFDKICWELHFKLIPLAISDRSTSRLSRCQTRAANYSIPQISRTFACTPEFFFLLEIVFHRFCCLSIHRYIDDSQHTAIARAFPAASNTIANYRPSLL